MGDDRLLMYGIRISHGRTVTVNDTCGLYDETIGISGQGWKCLFLHDRCR